MSPRQWLAVGLTLIAVAAGAIKPCVSAHVGDQFGARNKHLLPRVFAWFYFAINLGAFVSQLLTPWLLESMGAQVAFGLPGVLMALATLLFWMGRNRFVHVPPAGKSFVKEAFSGAGLRALLRLSLIYLFISVFWALFDQTGSAWVQQAKRMDLTLLGVEVLPSQIQAANPLLILLFIPLFNYVLYPALGRVMRLTALRKIALGMFLTVPTFLLTAHVAWRLSAGESVSVAWQVLGYVILTAAEVLVSITSLEFSYTQAPNRMKSFVMSVYLLSVSVGNGFVALVNSAIQRDDGTSRWSETEYHLFFAAAMAVAAVGFSIVARFYRERTYVQGEAQP